MTNQPPTQPAEQATTRAAVGAPPSRLVCFGCGRVLVATPEDPAPLSCPDHGRADDVDHVLRRVLDPGLLAWPHGDGTAVDQPGVHQPGLGQPEADQPWTDQPRDQPVDPASREASAREEAASADDNPFLRWRTLLHAYHASRAAGLDDAGWCALVRALDQRVAAVDGHGFRTTPCRPADQLAARLGLAPGDLWVKDETGSVSGSHKARHLMATMSYLAGSAADRPAGSAADPPGGGEARSPVGDPDRPPVRALGNSTSNATLPPLAIASCGNAALAAAVVARAAGRALEVFVPPSAHPRVLARLAALGARITTCPRLPDERGDPCYRHFRAAVAAGAIPFCCQGPDNGLAIEGGATLAWEILDVMADRPADRVFVQVGGGALASALALGFADALAFGKLARLPRLHAVQTAGCFPLARAYERVVALLLGEPTTDPTVADAFDGASDSQDRVSANRQPAGTLDRPSSLGTLGAATRERRADFLRDQVPASRLAEVLHHAATHRSQFMVPWPSEPVSLATGILDDETYDWLAVVEAMVRSGGYPIVVAEPTVARAHQLARATTAIDADATGTAGLAGLLQLIAGGLALRDERSVVLFTGRRRDA